MVCKKPMTNEWQFTELRSDNSKQGSPGSTASTNRDLSDLDMFIAKYFAPGHIHLLGSIHTATSGMRILFCKSLGVTYDPASGSLTFNNINNSYY